MGLGLPGPSTIEITFPTFGDERIEVYSEPRFIEGGLPRTRMRTLTGEGKIICYFDGAGHARLFESNASGSGVTYWVWRDGVWQRAEDK